MECHFFSPVLKKRKKWQKSIWKNSKVAKRKRKTHANSNLQTFIILIWRFHSLLLIFQRSLNWKSWEKFVMKFHLSWKYPCTTLYIFFTDLRFSISLSSLFLHQKVTINFANCSTHCSIRASLGMWSKSGRLQHTEGLSKQNN